jgi:predicted 3-demethylubiquinone-9 3-methyltransferase (glyoxalase superfamily)
MPRQTISAFLWFEDQAEDAARFYVSIFNNSRITGTTRYDEKGASAAGRPLGSVNGGREPASSTP